MVPGWRSDRAPGRQQVDVDRLELNLHCLSHDDSSIWSNALAYTPTQPNWCSHWYRIAYLRALPPKLLKILTTPHFLHTKLFLWFLQGGKTLFSCRARCVTLIKWIQLCVLSSVAKRRRLRTNAIKLERCMQFTEKLKAEWLPQALYIYL